MQFQKRLDGSDDDSALFLGNSPMGNFRHRHKNFHVPSFPRAILHNHLSWSSFLHILILRCYQELTPFGIFKYVRYGLKKNIFGMLSTNGLELPCFMMGIKYDTFLWIIWKLSLWIIYLKCCKLLFKTTFFANCRPGYFFVNLKT